jgi:hypothetical protein
VTLAQRFDLAYPRKRVHVTPMASKKHKKRMLSVHIHGPDIDIDADIKLGGDYNAIVSAIANGFGEGIRGKPAPDTTTHDFDVIQRVTQDRLAARAAAS